jgi:acyl carrier protein
METDTTSIEYRVIDIIAYQLKIDRTEIQLENRFNEDLNADSLDTTEIILELEEEFSITIPEEDAQKVKTVGEAVDYIREHCPEEA